MNLNNNNYRHIIEYSKLEEQEITNNINKLKQEFIKIKEKHQIYDNQIICAKEIVEKFNDRSIIGQGIIGKTQSGKTGVISEIIRQYIQNNLIPIQNILVITGLSMKEWKDQTKDRLPPMLHPYVIHRSNMRNLSNEYYTNRKNMLILIDELHIANEIKHTMGTKFCSYWKWNELNQLLVNDIKIVQISATPETLCKDYETWGINAVPNITKYLPGNRYISAYDLLTDPNNPNRVKQFKPLYSKKIDENIIYENIKELIIDILSYKEPKYHIIRISKGDTYNDKDDDVINNIMKILQQCDNEYNNDKYSIMKYCDRNTYNNELTNTITNINQTLSDPPNKQTFVFIKERLRAAVTLEKKIYLGVLYERYSNIKYNSSTIIQGLIGRVTGYYDDINKYDFIVYTDKNIIEEYEKNWNNYNFDYNCKKKKNITNSITDKTEKKIITKKITSLQDIYVLHNKNFRDLEASYNSILKTYQTKKKINKRDTKLDQSKFKDVNHVFTNISLEEAIIKLKEINMNNIKSNISFGSIINYDNVNNIEYYIYILTYKFNK